MPQSQFRCTCQQAFEVQLQPFEQTVQCPRCGQALTIPPTTHAQPVAPAPGGGFPPEPQPTAPVATSPVASTPLPQQPMAPSAGGLPAPMLGPHAAQTGLPTQRRKSPKTTFSPFIIIGCVLGGLVVIGIIAGLVVAMSGGDIAWLPYDSTTGQYQVKFPGIPKHSRQTSGPISNRVTAYLSQVDQGNRGAFGVLYLDLPARALQGTRDRILDRAAKTLTASMQGTQFRSSSEISLDKWPGKEFEITGQYKGKSTVALVRIYLARSRLYLVSWVGPAQSVPKKRVQRLFESFRIKLT